MDVVGRSNATHSPPSQPSSASLPQVSGSRSFPADSFPYPSTIRELYLSADSILFDLHNANPHLLRVRPPELLASVDIVDMTCAQHTLANSCLIIVVKVIISI